MSTSTESAADNYTLTHISCLEEYLRVAKRTKGQQETHIPLHQLLNPIQKTKMTQHVEVHSFLQVLPVFSARRKVTFFQNAKIWGRRMR